jgi:hypothetical protein
MNFAKRLRERVVSGEITCSVSIWRGPRVKVGGRYRPGSGAIEVRDLLEIGFEGVSGDLARSSGFDGLVDLLKTAKHGSGERVYLVTFRYLAEDKGQLRRGQPGGVTSLVRKAPV